MPLQCEDGVLPLAPGAQLLPIHPLNAALEPVQNIILDGQLQSKDPDTEEPKKRKGGWPKGKKRKQPKEFSAPRAPTTGYVIFVNEKKVHLKAEHPDIPFTEITKMLGTRWSQLSQEEKQKYNNAAEKDKQRFIEELQAYQNSEAYKAFLKRKTLHKVKVLCGVEMVDSEFENEIVALSQMDVSNTKSHLTSSRFSELWVVVDQCEDGVLPLAPGAQLLPIHPLNAALEPVQNIILDGQLQSKDPDTEEPKKRKGGWPKGKKRKQPKEFSAPRAPTTGYVIFVNEKKVHLKAEHPDIPFTEITKMLGTRWSQLSQEEKQKYNNAAEKDKQRFIEELQAYQNSEAYKAFLKRKTLHKVKVLCGVEMVDSEFENEIVALSQMDGGDTSDLYCRTCNQYFSSLHNKKEHLLGKQHLQNLTEEFEKETVGLCKEQQDEGEEELETKDEDSEEEEVAVAELAQLCGLASQHSFTSLDLGFLQEFIFKQMTLKEFELSELNTSMEKATEKHDNLNRQLEDLQHSFTSLDLGFLQEFIFKQMTLKEFELSELNTSMEKATEKHDNLNRQLEDLQNQQIHCKAEKQYCWDCC
ncbi:UNVERIFIED_CONTAM: hypothetical protein FKN15_043374 [Acipenser sinensis]